MNIVYIAPFAFSPKATVSMRMLPMAQALVQRGHSVTILVPPYDNPTDSGRQWLIEGVKLINIHIDGSTTSALAFWRQASQLAQHSMALQPDAIHIFKPVGPGALAMYQLRQHGVRNIILDNDDWEGRGGWLDINQYPILQKVVMAWQEKWCIRHAKAVTCASDTLRSRSIYLGQTAASVTVMPNGPAESLKDIVNTATRNREQLRAQFGWQNKRVLVYAGTVPLNHDLDIAVKAIASARRIYLDILFVVIAAGDGLPTLKTVIQNSAIESCVVFHTFLPHEHLIEFLVASDVALYPYRDTNINKAKCSGKVVDYMACGLPMVVSNVGMNATYIDDGITGLLTKPGDATSFTSALESLLSDPESAKKMGVAAQQKIWDHFRWAKRIGELEDIYRSTAS